MAKCRVQLTVIFFGCSDKQLLKISLKCVVGKQLSVTLVAKREETVLRLYSMLADH